MEPIVYDTVMNANRTGHERYVEKMVILKATHTSQCELPNIKAKVLSDYKEN